ADAQSQSTDEPQQDLEAERDDFELVNLLHKIKNKHGAPISGIESVLRRHNVAHRSLDPFIVVGLVIEPDGVEVVGVLQITHGGEGHVDHAINIVIASLHLRAEHADDLKADAIDADILAQSVASGKKFLFRVGTDDRNPRPLVLIFRIEEPPLREAQSADGESVGIFAVDSDGV